MKKMLPPHRAAQKALTLASNRVHAFVSDAKYFTLAYDPIYASRWRRNARRRKAKITRALNAAAKAARFIGTPNLIIAVAEARYLAKTTIRYCDSFPVSGLDAREWVGTETLRQFDAEIAQAKRLLRGVSA